MGDPAGIRLREYGYGGQALLSPSGNGSVGLFVAGLSSCGRLRGVRNRMPVSRPDCVRSEGRQISIWPPSPVLRHDTTQASHRTRFPVNARGDMAAVHSGESVPPLSSVPRAGARRRRRMRDPGAVAEYSIPAMASPAPPRHRPSPRAGLRAPSRPRPPAPSLAPPLLWAANRDV